MSRTEIIACRCLDCGDSFSHRARVNGVAGGPEACPRCGSRALHWLEWFVVHTETKGEPIADRKLRSLGYETFFPRYRTLVRHARRVTEVVRAFLPRYLFVGVAPQQGLYGVNTAEGVATVLHSGGRPARLAESLVTEWRERMGAGGVIEVPSVYDRQRPKLAPGQEVRIIEGPFTGMTGIVELDSGREVALWVEAFQRRVKAQFPIEALSPVVRRHRG